MNIKVLSPWKQDASLGEREDVYLKRLRKYASLDIEEVKGIKGESRQAVRTEGEKLLSRIRKGSFTVALTENGKGFDSAGFSRWLDDMGLSGRSDITFVIGGAAGLDEGVIKSSDMELSLSRMTMQHQIARLVLVEQIYRAFTMIRGEPYHK